MLRIVIAGIKQEQDPGRQLEEFLERGIPIGKDIRIGKDEEEEPIQQQESDDRDITGKAAKKLTKFFFANGPHRMRI